MQYLNQNAGAIQTITSLLTVITTVVLVVITWRYVKLTNKLALFAGEELKYQEQALLSRKTERMKLVKFFRDALDQLDSTEQDAERRMKQATIWNDSQLHQLQKALFESSTGLQKEETTLITSLQFLKGLVDKVQSTPELLGYQWRKFPWGKWAGEVKQSKQSLNTILQMYSEAV